MYSKTKLYQKTAYQKQRVQSYDRLLKEANLQGSGDPKESMLEKPYKSKTYSTMQQEYNPPLPPTIDPGGGTGGLKCIWTSTGCEQLVGCWAGSDIVITGPEANTAGYIDPIVQTGEIVSQTISGSENRGIDFTLSTFARQNVFTVRFKDGLGAIHEVPISINCAQPNTWQGFDSGITVSIDQRGLAIESDSDLHITARQSGTGLIHITWDGVNYSQETIDAFGSGSDCVLDSSGYLHVASGGPLNGVRYYTNATGSWVSTDVYTAANYVSSFSIMLDSSGYVHIVGVVYDTEVIHSTNASGSWQTETVVSVSGTRYIDFARAIIKSDNTILVAYTTNDYYPLTATGYIKYITGSYGSWSAITTVKSGSYFWDSPALIQTADGNIHILNTDSGLGLDEYYYNGSSWQERSISTSYMRVPSVTSKANQLFTVATLDIAGTYYPNEFVYSTSWSLPEAVWSDVQSSFGTYGSNIIYDSSLDALHYIFRNSSNNLGHAIRYL